MGTGQMSVTESKGIPRGARRTCPPNKQYRTRPQRSLQLSKRSYGRTGVLVTLRWLVDPSTQLLDRAVVGLVAKQKAGRCLIDDY